MYKFITRIPTMLYKLSLIVIYFYYYFSVLLARKQELIGWFDLFIISKLKLIDYI